MKNEIRGFIFLALSVICLCTHQICDKLFWVTAHLNTVRPTNGSWMYGGVVLFSLAIVFMIIAVCFFVKSFKKNKS